MFEFRTAAFAAAIVCAIGLNSFGSAQAAAGWKTLQPMPTVVNSPAVGEINGIIYVAGGVVANFVGPTAALQAYDPTKNMWSTLASMPETLYQGDGTGTIDSQLYVAGGRNGSSATNTLYVFDPSSGWAIKANMPHTSACGVTGVVNSKLYVTSGCVGDSGSGFKFLDVYDPATNAWTSLASSMSGHQYGVGGFINGKLYLAGGIASNGAVTGVTEVYDPSTNTWEKLAKMRIPLHDASGVVLNGKLWVFGGADSASNFQLIVQVYDPITNQWTHTAQSLPVGNSGSGAAVTYGLAFVEGSGGSTGPTNDVLAVLPSVP